LCSWVKAQGGNASIKVNDQISPYFQAKKELRQVILCPQYLMVDMLAILAARASDHGQVQGECCT